MYKALTTMLGIILLLSVTTVIAGPAPKLINYQAALEDSNGDPVTSQVSVTFRIYDAATSKAILWEETRLITPDANGMFSINLGETSPVSDGVFSASERWLGITIGTDSELTPRTRLASAPYSMRVETIDQAEAGTLHGPLVIDESAAKLALPYIELVSAGNERVKICASACPVMSATNEAGNEVLNLSMGSSVDPALFVVKGPGGDDDNQAMFGSAGTEIFVNDGRGIQKTYELTSSSGFQAFSSADPSDVLVHVSEDVAACGGEVEVNACGLGKGITRMVRIAPADNVVLSATEENDDNVFLVSSGANGASLMVATSDAAKSDPKLVTSSVIISPETNTPLKALDNAGEPLIELSTVDATPMITLTNQAKAGSRVQIREDGIYFFDATRAETTMVISADGSIHGQGSLAMGQNVVNPGDWTNILGIDNSATGDSSGILGGYQNSVEGATATIGGGVRCSIFTLPGRITPHHAFIAGGARNATGGAYSFMGTGQHNRIEHQYGVILCGQSNYTNGFYATVLNGDTNSAGAWCSIITGGERDTITAAGRFSMAYGNGVLVEQPYKVVFFDGDSSGALSINRDNDGSTTIDHPVHVGTNTTNGNGAHCTAGGVWTDAGAKAYNKSLGRLDGLDVLDRIGQISVELWESDGTGERHLRPGAENFHAQFDVGTVTKDGARDNEHLAAADIAGVALIGVQELYRMVQEQQQLAQELQSKDKKIEELELRLTQMETLVEAIMAQQGGSGGDKLAVNK